MKAFVVDPSAQDSDKRNNIYTHISMSMGLVHGRASSPNIHVSCCQTGPLGSSGSRS